MINFKAYRLYQKHSDDGPTAWIPSRYDVCLSLGDYIWLEIYKHTEDCFKLSAGTGIKTYSWLILNDDVKATRKAIFGDAEKEEK